MGIINLRGRFKGRESWKTANRTLFLIIYTFMFFGMIGFRQYMWIAFLALGLTIPWYIVFFVLHIRNKEKEKKGDEVFGGWTEHRQGKGELKYFYPDEIVPYERLSEIDKTAVDDFMVFIAKKTEEQIKMGLEDKKTKKPPKLLTLEETQQKEQDELDELKREFEVIYNQKKAIEEEEGNV